MSYDTLRHYIGHLPDAPRRDRLLYLTGRGAVAARFGEVVLSSAFQRIESGDGVLHGHAGYATATRPDGGAVPIRVALETVAGDAVVDFDRLCRTVHVLNYFGGSAEWTPLVLCLDPRLLRMVPEEHGATFQRVVTGFGVLASRIILTLPRAAAAEPGLFEHVLPSYRLRNFRIAVEAAGEPRAAAARLARLQPDFVVAHGADHDLREWTAAAHDAGAQLRATHLETPEQRDEALAAGADLLQGHVIGRPAGGTAAERQRERETS